MDVSIPCRFTVEATGPEGQVLGDYTLVGLDFESALRCVHLGVMRRGGAEVSSQLPPATIVPTTCLELGAPYVSGFEVRFPGGAPRFSSSYGKMEVYVSFLKMTPPPTR